MNIEILQSKNNRIIAVLIAVSFISCLAYTFYKLNPSQIGYAMSLRMPKLIVMAIVAYAIGKASIIFQSIINNTIVTPCLLGMNSLYTLIHTSVVFFLGSQSIFARDANISFLLDLILMGVVATVIYKYLFEKTKYNVLYVLLTGTILASFFTSIQSSMIRVMDPNEYDALLSSLVASFSNINSNLIGISIVALVVITFLLRKQTKLLDVIALGKDQAINLGVDFDKTITKLLLGVTLYIAVATALVGPISFLGLIIANLSRQLLQTYKHSYLIAGCVFIGVVVLVVAQTVVERIYIYSMPISVFISVAGGCYFLYLLLKQRKAY
ncbi:iron chelate uptake ABC transporter family permease subunit [Mycoplasma sp. P36-A1]|uniref:iron chelate uptake ABC transporter family permease subunit n=1 Tax=Mycoplasma sp. P36-A1 TaxID=3252900 RepID=UPI003C2E07B2